MKCMLRSTVLLQYVHKVHYKHNFMNKEITQLDLYRRNQQKWFPEIDLYMKEIVITRDMRKEALS